MKIINDKEYLSLGEAAKYAGLSRMTLNTRLDQRNIQRLRSGLEKLVAKDDLESVSMPLETPVSNTGISIALLSDPRLNQEDGLLLADCIRYNILSMRDPKHLKVTIDALCLERIAGDNDENTGDIIRKALKSFVEKAHQEIASSPLS